MAWIVPIGVSAELGMLGGVIDVREALSVSNDVYLGPPLFGFRFVTQLLVITTYPLKSLLPYLTYQGALMLSQDEAELKAAKILDCQRKR